MCGICGIVGPNARAFPEQLDRMSSMLAHRGPDAHGTLFFDSCILDHRRLSIIDIDSGKQPMAHITPSHNLGIVFNGEIYNYQEIKKTLPGPFTTQSDTEVILAGFAALPIGALCERLKGMFAFAIWDENAQKLTCSRDRFGEKPLYFALLPDGHFIFSSEIQPIISSGLVRPTLDLKAMAFYLKYRFIPEGFSPYATIRQLPPASILEWQDGKIQIKRYWEKPAPLRPHDIDVEEAAREMRSLMQQAVTRCLVADVEVGLLLSGGLDSTTIAGVASQNKKLRSFCFGFEGARDERGYAKDVAAQYALPFQELTDKEMDLPYALLSVCKVYGEPFGDSSAIPMLQLCKKVAGEVKVALSGDGADELLGGYDYWYQPLLAVAEKEKNREAVLAAHDQALSHFSDETLTAMGIPCGRLPSSFPLSGTVDDALRLDLEGFLPSDILKKSDRASMHYGLELRSPFLDADLASFLISLPAEYKVSPTNTKILLRKAFEDIWPQTVRTRGKQGFGYDVSIWMRKPEVAMLKQSYLLNPKRKIRRIFTNPYLEFCAQNHGQQSWLTLMLAIWLESATWEI